MNSNKKIKVGSRKSELALIQTRHVISLLSNLHPEKEFEIVTMNTLGDKVLDVPLPKIGEKSLFTKELETSLATGCVDFVVHSLKDLPTCLPEGMAIGAVLEREDPRDALVVKINSTATNLNDLKEGSVIGTSSLRRTAQLARNYPHLRVESIRGNLNTRMRKLDELDNFSAIVLAQAGLSRMGWKNRITSVLKCEQMMYAVGQGALAVECRENDTEILNLLHPLHCPKTLLRIIAERSFLRTLGGGCSAPVAVSSKLSLIEDKLNLNLIGGVWSLDGKTELKDTEKCTVEVKSIDNETSITTCPLGYEQDLSINQISVKTKTIESSYEAPPLKKQKIDVDLLNVDDPHKHCPVSIPVGLDFMGKCPYLASTSQDSNSENQIEILSQNDYINFVKCPYLKNKEDNTNSSTAEADNNKTESQTNGPKEKSTKEEKKIVVCPCREPKLYCGVVSSKKTPLWALEQAEQLGINLAEKLLKSGALDVMQAAQAEIRGNI